MTDRKNSQTPRVASYNIRKTRGLDQQYDPHRIIAVINRLNADVVALQEADHRLGQRPAALSRALIEGETDFQVVPVAANDKSVGWHGNAVLVRRGVQADLVDRIDLPGLEPRGAVHVRVDLGYPVEIIATHLGLLRRHRRRQLSTLAKQLETRSHAIIVGDFNEWSFRRGLEPLAAGFDVHAPGRSFHAARPLAALDRLAMTPALSVAAGGVLDDPAARRASDHLPVWVDLQISAIGSPVGLQGGEIGKAPDARGLS